MTATATLGNLQFVITRAFPAKAEDFADGVIAYFSANLTTDDGLPVAALNGMQLVQDEDGNYYIRTMKRSLKNGRILSAFTFYPGAEKNDALRNKQRELYNNTAELIKAKLKEFGHEVEDMFEV